mgnify:CR=1 FL=1
MVVVFWAQESKVLFLLVLLDVSDSDCHRVDGVRVLGVAESKLSADVRVDPRVHDLDVNDRSGGVDGSEFVV